MDASGLRVEELASKNVDAVVVTPAHQFPTGAVLAADRRAALTEWLRRRGAIAIEDDYDAEYRYDRAPVGALQGLDPERVVYAGSTSKTLAPALRTGWLVVPHPLLEGVAREKLLADRGTARIEQFALADFIDRGELDRDLRRMRIRYRRRREALLEALAEQAPQSSRRWNRSRPPRGNSATRGSRGEGHPRRGPASSRRHELDRRVLHRPFSWPSHTPARLFSIS